MADGAIMRLVIRLRAAAAAQKEGKACTLPVAVLDAANELLEVLRPRTHSMSVSQRSCSSFLLSKSICAQYVSELTRWLRSDLNKKEGEASQVSCDDDARFGCRRRAMGAAAAILARGHAVRCRQSHICLIYGRFAQALAS